MTTLQPLTPRILEDLSHFFKMLGDPTRIRILQNIASGDRCVQDISTDLDMSPSAVSHQLRLLKQAHLVKGRRDGRHMLYSLDDDHVKTIFNQGVHHVSHLYKESSDD